MPDGQRQGRRPRGSAAGSGGQSRTESQRQQDAAPEGGRASAANLPAAQTLQQQPSSTAASKAATAHQAFQLTKARLDSMLAVEQARNTARGSWLQLISAMEGGELPSSFGAAAVAASNAKWRQETDRRVRQQSAAAAPLPSQEAAAAPQQLAQRPLQGSTAPRLAAALPSQRLHPGATRFSGPNAGLCTKLANDFLVLVSTTTLLSYASAHVQACARRLLANPCCSDD